jgi:formate hydrogenlyase subunit 6/NADH:ubiquinone oxidoreductase subunit I
MEKQIAVEVLITVADEYMQRLKAVAEGLKKAGMTIKQISNALGTITGTVPKVKMPKLAKVRGVSAVEESQVYQLPPPDAYAQ